jgi:hypothetical protein
MKRFYLVVAGILLFAVYANAGILSVMKETAGAAASSGSLWAGLAAVAILYIFKVIPNAKIYGFVKALFRKGGIVVTLGLSKWKWSAPLWNTVIEKWIIDFVENTVGAALAGLIEGLHTDNPKE